MARKRRRLQWRPLPGRRTKSLRNQPSGMGQPNLTNRTLWSYSTRLQELWQKILSQCPSGKTSRTQRSCHLLSRKFSSLPRLLMRSQPWSSLPSSIKILVTTRWLWDPSSKLVICGVILYTHPWIRLLKRIVLVSLVWLRLLMPLNLPMIRSFAQSRSFSS